MILRGVDIVKKSLHGRVHNKTIELDEDPGMAEGEAIEIQVMLLLCRVAFAGGALAFDN